MRFFWLFIFLPFLGAAQPKGWQEITISDGLSQGMIYDLEQDQKGFIWVATKDGLNRYDGHNFTVFSHDSYNDFSLSDNNCSVLFIDSKKRLWVGTLNQGLNLFDDHSQRFYHIDINDQAVPNAGNYEINLLTEDPEGSIWVGTGKNRLFKINLPAAFDAHFPATANFTGQVRIQQITLPATAFTGLVHHLSFGRDGTAQVGTAEGIYAFNWRHPTAPRPLSLSADTFPQVYTLYGDAKQSTWLATTADRVICWQGGRQKTVALPRAYASVTLKVLDDTTVAVATTDFLWLMSTAELGRQDSLTARNSFLTFPPNVYAVTDLLRDRTGNLWVGTSGYGLRKFNPKIRQFHSYLANTTLNFLYADRQGRLYARHEFAYGQVDRTTDRLVPFLATTLPAADKRQRYMMQDRKGNFWVSNVHFETHDRHLFKFSATWQLLKKYPLPPDVYFGFYGNQTLEDKVGYLWLGAANGILLRFDPVTEAFRRFSYQSLLPRSGTESETYALHQDQAGTIWIGTQQGLIRAAHPHTTPVFSIYKNSKTDRNSLSNEHVLSLADDPDQPARYLWVGTKGGGLERLDKQPGNAGMGHFAHFTEAQGLPNKVVYGILTDEFRNLWLSTNRGLAQFNPRTGRFRTYTKADGLQDDEFNTGSYGKTPTGELLFGGVNGLTGFRASAVNQTPQTTPLVNLIGLKVNNEAVFVGGPDGILPQAIEHTATLDLAYNQNLLTLEFGVMDYTNSAKNRYRYRLEDIDRDWVEAGTNRFANYAQLPGGNFTFQVIGSPDGEVWSQPVTLQIRVHPPFYRTWWAYLLYSLLATAIGWQLYRFQTQRLLLQQQVLFKQAEASRLAELDGLKTEFFTNISHEFRTPLTLILGPLTDLKRRLPNEPVLTLMERNGQRLLSLINQLLDLSKIDAGQLRPEPTPGDLAAFFRTLASSFSSLAESRQIQLTCTLPTTTLWASFDRDKLEKIVTNLLGNAFKFTPAGKAVRLNIHGSHGRQPDVLTIVVQDTGIGIAPENLPHIFERFYQRSADAGDGRANRSYEGTGIGLALVHELVRVLAGTIDVTSTDGMGTTFTVRLPLIMVPAPVASGSGSPAPAAALPEPLLTPPTAGQEDSRPARDPEKLLLIIDDSADIRAYVRSIFAADYQILDAVDGQNGLEEATAHLPDIVICDLMMPRLDGFGFCKALKTQIATSHIPVVMLTAKATVEDRIEGFEQGADEYLTKPFNRAELQARVRNLIQQRERLRPYFATGLPTPEPGQPVVSTLLRAGHTFLDRLTAVIGQHLDDTDFTVEILAEAVHMSRVQLHRKLRALTNKTATTFIRDVRLTKAAELLATGEQTVTQVAYAVGFDNLSYFAKVFQEQYGVLPSQYGKAAVSLQ